MSFILLLQDAGGQVRRPRFPYAIPPQEQVHIGLDINDALERGLPTDAPAELPVFAFKGIDVLRCELALETGSHPDNEGDELVLPHLS